MWERLAETTESATPPAAPIPAPMYVPSGPASDPSAPPKIVAPATVPLARMARSSVPGEDADVFGCLVRFTTVTSSGGRVSLSRYSILSSSDKEAHPEAALDFGVSPGFRKIVARIPAPIATYIPMIDLRLMEIHTWPCA